MHASNKKVAAVFTEIAHRLEVQGGDRFRIASYHTVAQRIKEWGQDVFELSDGDLRRIPGVGAGTVKKILEIKRTGTCSRLKELKASGTPSLSDVRTLRGVGAATARKLWQEYGVKNMKDLSRLLKQGKLPPKLARKIEKALKDEDRIPREEMLRVLNPLIRRLKKFSFIEQLEVAGSLRRRLPTVRDVDIVVAVNAKDIGKLKLACADVFGEVSGQTKKLSTTITVHGTPRHVDIVITNKGSFGAALNYLTGSAQHNIYLRKIAKAKGLRVNEHGIYRNGVKVGGEREEDLFELLGIPYMEPHKRVGGPY